MDQHPLGDGPGFADGTVPGDPASSGSAPAARRTRRALGRRGLSIPGAVGGAFLITAIAFGATATLTAPHGATGDGARTATTSDGPTTGAADGAAGAGADGQIGGDTGGSGGEHGANLGTEPGSETGDGPGATEAPGATEPGTGAGDATGDRTADGAGATDTGTGGDGGTTADPTTEPTTAPATEPLAISIELHLGDGKITIAWGDCPSDAFVAWKVVRSLDGNPTWPLGSGDQLVAGSDNHALGSVANGDLPAGRTVYYRVVGLVTRNGETVVGCRSRTADIQVPSADPTPAPTTEPDPIGSIGLTLTLDGGHPHADWTTCPGDWDIAFVVRSTNNAVSYPLGSGDAIAGAAGKDGATALTDANAAAGHTFWYRVFCTRKVSDGYQVVAASPTREIATPAPDPLPEPSPVGLDLNVQVTDGGIALSWGACTNEHFGSYRVIRSAGTNPSYLPATDGSVVVAVKENAGVTTFTDTTAEAGHTWHYRVQCIGWMNDHQILLGESDVASVTLP